MHLKTIAIHQAYLRIPKIRTASMWNTGVGIVTVSWLRNVEKGGEKVRYVITSTGVRCQVSGV